MTIESVFSEGIDIYFLYERYQCVKASVLN